MTNRTTMEHYASLGEVSDGRLRVQRNDKRYGTMWHCPHGHYFSRYNTIIQDSGSRLCRNCSNHRSREFNRRYRGEEKGLTGQELEDYVYDRRSRERADEKFKRLEREYELRSDTETDL